MDALTTASTKVAGHVATHSRPVAPAFLSRYSAERYRQDVMDAHVQQAWLAPDPVAATEHVLEMSRLARLDEQARRAQNGLLLSIAVLIALGCLLHLFL